MPKSLSVIGASDSPAPWGLMVSGPAGVGCSSLVQGQQMTGTLLLCMTRSGLLHQLPGHTQKLISNLLCFTPEGVS